MSKTHATRADIPPPPFPPQLETPVRIGSWLPLGFLVVIGTVLLALIVIVLARRA